MQACQCQPALLPQRQGEQHHLDQPLPHPHQLRQGRATRQACGLCTVQADIKAGCHPGAGGAAARLRWPGSRRRCCADAARGRAEHSVSWPAAAAAATAARGAYQPVSLPLLLHRRTALPDRCGLQRAQGLAALAGDPTHRPPERLPAAHQLLLLLLCVLLWVLGLGQQWLLGSLMAL